MSQTVVRRRSHIRSRCLVDQNDQNDHIREGCSKSLNYKWSEKNDDVLGKGFYGTVYKCTRRGTAYALKVQTDKRAWQNEIQALTILAGKRIAPKLVDCWTCEGIYYIVIELIPGETLDKQSQKSVSQIKTAALIKFVKNIQRMNKDLGVFHNDLDDTNIMWDKKRKKFIAIDFGEATLSRPNYEIVDKSDWEDLFAKQGALGSPRFAKIKQVFLN